MGAIGCGRVLLPGGPGLGDMLAAARGLLRRVLLPAGPGLGDTLAAARGLLRGLRRRRRSRPA